MSDMFTKQEFEFLELDLMTTEKTQVASFNAIRCLRAELVQVQTDFKQAEESRKTNADMYERTLKERFEVEKQLAEANAAKEKEEKEITEAYDTIFGLVPEAQDENGKDLSVADKIQRLAEMWLVEHNAKERAEAKCAESIPFIKRLGSAFHAGHSLMDGFNTQPESKCERNPCPELRELLNDNPGQPLLDRLHRVKALVMEAIGMLNEQESGGVPTQAIVRKLEQALASGGSNEETVSLEQLPESYQEAARQHRERRF